MSRQDPTEGGGLAGAGPRRGAQQPPDAAGALSSGLGRWHSKLSRGQGRAWAFSRDLWPAAEHRPQPLLAMWPWVCDRSKWQYSSAGSTYPQGQSLNEKNYKEYWAECLTHSEDSINKRQEGSVILLSKQQCKAGYIIIPLLGIRKQHLKKIEKIFQGHAQLQTTGHQSQIIKFPHAVLANWDDG